VTIPDYRAQILALRNSVGAKSDAGGHISNLIEQLANYGREKDEGARERLRGFISQSILKLSQQ
jgi:hypothetical protein